MNDEQYEQIGREIAVEQIDGSPYASISGLNKRVGQYAVAACKRHGMVEASEALKEPSGEELALTWNEECAGLPTDRTDWPFLVKRLIANRLARLTQQPDARVTLSHQISGLFICIDGEAIVEMLRPNDVETAHRIVAALAEIGEQPK